MEEKKELQNIISIGTPGTFQFSAINPDELQESEYTIAVTAVDTTGSLAGWESKIEELLKTIVKSCQKDARRDFILLRQLQFNSGIGIKEFHGFLEVPHIDLNCYKIAKCDNMTNLCDVAVESISCIQSFSKILKSRDYDVNAILFIVTDGMDNDSSFSLSDIRKKMEEIVHDEEIESFITILIGLNDEDCDQYLKEFKKETGFAHQLSAGQVDEDSLAKIAGFISSSISSQSQALGSGGPSTIPTF